jgi:hypothetical protein
MDYKCIKQTIKEGCQKDEEEEVIGFITTQIIYKS